MTAPEDKPDLPGFQSQPLLSGGQIQHASLRICYDYWLGKVSANPAPSIGEIDLLDLSQIAPNLILLDVETGPEFRFSLVGTHVVERFGIDPTGMCISQLPAGEFVDTSSALMKAVVLESRPYWHEPKASVFPDRSHVRYEYVVLPLLGRDGAVGKILTAVCFASID